LWLSRSSSVQSNLRRPCWRKSPAIPVRSRPALGRWRQTLNLRRGLPLPRRSATGSTLSRSLVPDFGLERQMSSSGSSARCGSTARGKSTSLRTTRDDFKQPSIRHVKREGWASLPWGSTLSTRFAPVGTRMRPTLSPLIIKPGPSAGFSRTNMRSGRDMAGRQATFTTEGRLTRSRQPPSRVGVNCRLSDLSVVSTVRLAVLGWSPSGVPCPTSPSADGPKGSNWPDLRSLRPSGYQSQPDWSFRLPGNPA